MVDASLMADSWTTEADPALSASTSSQDLEHVRLVVFKIVMPAVIAFGVVGNLINITVLTHRGMRSSTTNRYLTCLAVYDILYLVFALSLGLKHYPAVGSTRPYAEYRAHVGRPLTDTWSNTGVWLTVTFTVERYVCVSHPMHGIVWCTVRRAKVIIAVICASAALITLPEFFAVTTRVHQQQVTSNTTQSPADQVWDASYNAFGQSPGYSLGYVYVNQALFTFLPLVLLVVFNGLLVRSLVRSSIERKTLTSASGMAVASSKTSTLTSTMDLPAAVGVTNNPGNPDHRITVMLIGVSVVFLVCQVPQAVYQMYFNLANPPMSDTLRLVATVLNLLVVINCSANFVLYSSLSTKFRRTFSVIFLRSKRTKAATAPSTDDTRISNVARRNNGCGYQQLLQLPPGPAGANNGRRLGGSPETIRLATRGGRSDEKVVRPDRGLQPAEEPFDSSSKGDSLRDMSAASGLSLIGPRRDT